MWFQFCGSNVVLGCQINLVILLAPSFEFLINIRGIGALLSVFVWFSCILIRCFMRSHADMLVLARLPRLWL